MIPSPAPLEPLILITLFVIGVCVLVAVKTGTAAAKGRFTGVLRIGGRPTPAPSRAVFVPGRDADDDEEMPTAPEPSGGIAVPWKALGFASASLAGGMAVLAALLLAGTVTNYPKMYDRSVWAALSEHYGVHSAIPDQGYRAGIAFQGILDGESVECTVIPPSLVSCNGKDVPSRG